MKLNVAETLTKRKPSKRRTVLYVVILALILGAWFGRHLAARRAVQFKDCVAAKYDLRRETNFRFLTGACTAVGKDGGQVYVSQLRGFGADHHDSADVDVDHN